MIKSTKAHPRLFSRLGALSLLTVALVFGASAAPATAAVHQGWFSSYSTSDYVALGDSFTSGQGAPPYLSEPCLQSKYASYPVISAALSRHKLAANESCSGADTNAVMLQQLPQLAARGLTGSTSPVRLVTLTVGGIDAGSNAVLLACTPDPTTLACLTAFGAAQAALSDLPSKLVATYMAVSAAMPNATVVVFTYPRLFNPGVPPIGDTVNGATDALDLIITGAVGVAASYGANVRVVDVTQEFANHGIGAKIPYISFDPTNLSAPANFHPNALGNSFGYFRALVHDGVLK